MSIWRKLLIRNSSRTSQARQRVSQLLCGLRHHREDVKGVQGNGLQARHRKASKLGSWRPLNSRDAKDKGGCGVTEHERKTALSPMFLSPLFPAPALACVKRSLNFLF